MIIPSYFVPSEVAGFTVDELDAVAKLANDLGWKTVLKYLEAIMEPVRPAVFSNVEPDKQLMLHQGLGAIYVASNLAEFVASARSRADLLVQQEESARRLAEQADPDGI